MLKTISLKKVVELPKLKTKRTKIYDKEWHMFFSSEEERQEFKKAIEKAENDTVSYTQEEFNKILYEKFNIKNL